MVAGDKLWMHFYLKWGLWILLPITYTEITLGRNLLWARRRTDLKPFQCTCGCCFKTKWTYPLMLVLPCLQKYTSHTELVHAPFYPKRQFCININSITYFETTYKVRKWFLGTQLFFHCAFIIKYFTQPNFGNTFKFTLPFMALNLSELMWKIRSRVES